MLISNTVGLPDQNAIDLHTHPFGIRRTSQYNPLGMAAVGYNPVPAIIFQAAIALPNFNLPPQPPPHHGPACHSCGNPSQLYSVNASNPNGNAGRQYYACGTCQFGRGWVSWADARGLHDTNPPCHCQRPSRKDMTGVYSARPNVQFWTCATGHCTYYSEVD